MGAISGYKAVHFRFSTAGSCFLANSSMHHNKTYQTNKWHNYPPHGCIAAAGAAASHKVSLHEVVTSVFVIAPGTLTWPRLQAHQAAMPEKKLNLAALLVMMNAQTVHTMQAHAYA